MEKTTNIYMEGNLPTKFVNQPSNSLNCPLCQKLFHDPVISTSCGHTFCRECIENRLRSRACATCPIDELELNHNGIVPNRAVQGQLEDLLIYCQHGLYRVDSDDDFQIDEDGCKEHIALGRRSEHEEQCLSAWVPCPNSSNYCGKFRKRDFEDHLLACQHNKCRNSERGCEFHGTREELQRHTCQCSFPTNGVEWEALASLDGENAMDGLQAKYLVKAVRNLNERVTSLEKGKEEILAYVDKCNRCKL